MLIMKRFKSQDKVVELLADTDNPVGLGSELINLI